VLIVIQSIHSKIVFSAIHGYELLKYGGDPSNPSEKSNPGPAQYCYDYDGMSHCIPINVTPGTTCDVGPEFPIPTEHFVSGNAFGEPIACGGNLLGTTTAINTCWRFDSDHQRWTSLHDMPTPRTYAAATTFTSRVRVENVYKF
jgi:hypothetical protein